MKQIETSAVDITTCPNWGKGGQYVIDPATGIRSRMIAPPEVAPVQSLAAGDDANELSASLPAETKSSKSSNKQEKNRE